MTTLSSLAISYDSGPYLDCNATIMSWTGCKLLKDYGDECKESSEWHTISHDTVSGILYLWKHDPRSTYAMSSLYTLSDFDPEDCNEEDKADYGDAHAIVCRNSFMFKIVTQPEPLN